MLNIFDEYRVVVTLHNTIQNGFVRAAPYVTKWIGGAKELSNLRIHGHLPAPITNEKYP